MWWIILFIYSINITNYIAIYNNQGYCTCEAKETPNDIFESGNVILSFGKTLIEVFVFNQVQNNNNNNTNNNNQNNNNKIEKKYEIPINNNNNPNNNNNDNNNNEILCVQLYQNQIICGHRSGFISLWNPTSGVYLQKKGELKVSESAINKMLYSKLQDGKDYLFLCCADGRVKILESGKVLDTPQNFGKEIMDIQMVNDFVGNTLFIISLKNGELKVLDLKLSELILDIPSRFSTNKERHVIGMKKPNNVKDDTIGDILIITEGKNLDIFTWIKPGSFNIKNPHNNMPYPPHQPHYTGPHYIHGKHH